jgi:hypothetical protein
MYVSYKQENTLQEFWKGTVTPSLQETGRQETPILVSI